MATIGERTLPEITKSSQLEPGKYYWLYARNGRPPIIKRCSECPDDDSCFYFGNFIAMEGYEQVFEIFEVRGPIPQWTIVI